MIKNLLFALQFLTVIPLKAGRAEDRIVRGAIACFPLVGFVIGAILVGADRLLTGSGVGQFTINTFLFILLMLITGGLHIDGLADTFDGIASGKDKGEMLRIMRDPHIGTIGTLSIISVIVLDIALLSEISVSFKIQSLLLMCILSRWSITLSMFLFPYARREGKAEVFFKNTDLKNFTLASIVTLFLVIAIWQLKGFLILVIVGLSAYISGRFINSKIGGLTGDSLGAINELMEVVTLLGIYILGKGVL